MRALGIDIGTTTISVIMVDGDSGDLLGSRTIAHRAFLKSPKPAGKIQDPQKLWNLTAKAAGELIGEFGKPDSIGLTGQMHGVLYADNNGEAVSPLYTWQDGSGSEMMADGRSYVEVLREATGMAAAGYGLTTHYYLQKNNLLPEKAKSMATISDYIGMRLCGKSESVISADMAASWGCYDPRRGDFCREELNDLEIRLDLLPELLPGYSVMGTTIENKEAGIPSGIPVTVSLGDNQASVLGSVNNLSDTVLVNIGTGSQVSMAAGRYVQVQGAVELRPFTDGHFLMAGSGLCGGRAYAMLETFYREAAGMGEDTDLYGRMEKQARDFLAAYGKEAAWKIRTTFSGTRSHPDERGSIYGIGVENFHPGAMTVGMLQGILEELYGLYRNMCDMTGDKARYLVGSGNGIRRNGLMQKLAEELFAMPLLIPACKEEAAFGAALQSLVSAGSYSSLAEAQQKVKYENAL